MPKQPASGHIHSTLETLRYCASCAEPGGQVERTLLEAAECVQGFAWRWIRESYREELKGDAKRRAKRREACKTSN